MPPSDGRTPAAPQAQPKASPTAAAAPDRRLDAVYPNAPDSLIKQWNQRRKPLTLSLHEALPPLDCDLKALALMRVAPPEDLAPGASAHAVKCHEIRREMVGMSELAALNALLIAHLRKRRAPEGTAQLFHRIWQEQAAVLVQELPPRWLISSAITFGDHGETEAQRRVGLSVNLLFSLMKLYEFERLYSGSAPDQAFATAARPKASELPFGMPQFALLSGGLDVNLLAPLWQMARDEPVVGPIACRLFTLLNEDPAGLFRRLDQMRTELKTRRALRQQRRSAPL